jgi:hypothetical protein
MAYDKVTKEEQIKPIAIITRSKPLFGINVFTK